MDPFYFLIIRLLKIALNRIISKQARAFIIFIYNVSPGQILAFSIKTVQAYFYILMVSAYLYFIINKFIFDVCLIINNRMISESCLCEMIFTEPKP